MTCLGVESDIVHGNNKARLNCGEPFVGSVPGRINLTQVITSPTVPSHRLFTIQVQGVRGLWTCDTFWGLKRI